MVRHLPLEQTCVGSNPASPVVNIRYFFGCFFSLVFTFLCGKETPDNGVWRSW